MRTMSAALERPLEDNHTLEREWQTLQSSLFLQLFPCFLNLKQNRKKKAKPTTVAEFPADEGFDVATLSLISAGLLKSRRVIAFTLHF